MTNKIILFCLFLFPIIACGQEQAPAVRADLELGKEFQLEDLTIKFLKVLSDSRCPKRVSCIWPGEARILLEIRVGGNNFIEEVVLSGSVANLSFPEKYKLQIFRLHPYPETAIDIAPHDYSLRLAVSQSSADQ